MTEFELHILMQEQAALFNSYLEFWLLYTSTLVVVGFFAGAKLGTGIRNLILFLYVAVVIISVVSWSDSIYGYNDYFERLVEQGGIPVRHIPGVEALPVMMALTFLAGTIGAIVYFLRVSSHSDS